MSLNAIVLTPDVHRHLKSCLAREYPEIPASYRAEALARGLGYRTNASLRADIGRNVFVTPHGEAFFTFLGRKHGTHNLLGFGSCLAETLFRQIPYEVWRWVLMPVVDESSYDERWPHYVPHVFADGLGMARAVMPDGFLKADCDRETALKAFVGADQSVFDLVPHSGPGEKLSRVFWDSMDDSRFTPAALTDGTPLRWIWVDQETELYELGAYTGRRSWPAAPA